MQRHQFVNSSAYEGNELQASFGKYFLHQKQKQRVREEQEKIEILKKSLHIFMQAQE